MSIRPVDLQVLIPRSAEINRADQSEARRPDTLHQMFSETLQKKVEHDLNQVLNTNKTEQDGVDKDGSNKNKHERNRKNNKKPAEDNKIRKAMSTSMIDISI